MVLLDLDPEPYQREAVGAAGAPHLSDRVTELLDTFIPQTYRADPSLRSWFRAMYAFGHSDAVIEALRPTTPSGPGSKAELDAVSHWIQTTHNEQGESKDYQTGYLRALCDVVDVMDTVRLGPVDQGGEDSRGQGGRKNEASA